MHGYFLLQQPSKAYYKSNRREAVSISSAWFQPDRWDVRPRRFGNQQCVVVLRPTDIQISQCVGILDVNDGACPLSADVEHVQLVAALRYVREDEQSHVGLIVLFRYDQSAEVNIVFFEFDDCPTDDQSASRRTQSPHIQRLVVTRQCQHVERGVRPTGLWNITII